MKNVTHSLDNEADRIIRMNMLGAFPSGIVPIPFVDNALSAAFQMNMIHGLAKLYEVEFPKQVVKATVLSIVSTSVADSVTNKIVKMLPGAGTFYVLLTSTCMDAMNTFALGQIFKRHFASGGTFGEVDLPKLQKDFKDTIANIRSGRQKVFA